MTNAAAEEESALYLALLRTDRHPDDLEAGIAMACALYHSTNTALVKYLRGRAKPGQPAKLGTPGRQTQSAAWCRAEAASFASITTLAAIFGVRHPSPSGFDPVQETRQLIAGRVGPLCNGWSSDGSDLIDAHHPALDCPVHPREENP